MDVVKVNPTIGGIRVSRSRIHVMIRKNYRGPERYDTYKRGCDL